MAKLLTGKVTSDRMPKTIVITVTERKTHPIYKKQYSVNTKFMAHDEKDEAKLGDVVSIVETRPVSARKRFKLNQVLERSGARFEEADAVADVELEVEKVKPAEKVAAKPKTEATAKAKKEDNDSAGN